MKDKLQLLINSESNLTRSAFAKMLGINPATISQIMAGRNKPSYELLQKILLRFPNVNPDWLIVDRGEMLRDASLTPSGIPHGGMLLPDAADDSETVAGVLDVDMPADASPFRQTDNQPKPAAVPSQGSAANDISDAVMTAAPHTGVPVERVVVFYADKTFDTYIPKK